MRTIVDFTLKKPQIAVDALSDATGLSKQRIKDAMAKGACRWTYKGKQVRLRKAKREVKAGTRLQLFYDDIVLARKAEPAELLTDFGKYSLWFKPHGLLAQGSQWGDHCSLLRVAEVQTGKPCFLVHRLDADAAGLMLIAHDSKAAAALSECFAGRALRKVYHARVCGKLEAQALTIDTPVDNKEAISHITTLTTGASEPDTNTVVEVIIETGRKHQIRQHLAGLGHPIVGDRLYGKPDTLPLQLVAVELEFNCPLTRKKRLLQLPPSLNGVLPTTP
ncbi:RNA pseudouridine synthase [Marinobacter sp. NP-4(2019)]|uniref:pseudouridine synthase family protein n=1 Tax=Marinobacter sp. NP-4(2019) TaxID=2488665 RepID=UPI000FC3CF5E|nr:RNA pseudouridine synthase [Marinobacter sp. NP-4(2019)]AZT84140.1 RNA pseudouridine synthase [Marinobacter sp. NP-4(2019)]